MSALCLTNVRRLYSLKKACVCFCETPNRHVTLGVVSNKQPKETVDAIIQMRKENLELFGKLLKTTKNQSGKELEESTNDGSAKTDSQTQPRKKRGRPKKIKTEDLSEVENGEALELESRMDSQQKQTETESSTDTESNQVLHSEAKKRGRPKKDKTLPETVSKVNNEETVEPKKRGRPKKVKSPDSEDNESNKIYTNCKTSAPPSDELDGAKAEITTSEPYNTTKDTNKSEEQLNNGGDSIGKNSKVLYVADEDEQVAASSPSLTSLLAFPFFHPTKREYFVSVPKVPEIYIPGYSERAKSDNPFFPSVGTILGATQPPESRMMLKRWRENLVKEMGEEGFQKYQKELLARGSNFHTVIEHYLKGDPEPDSQLKEENCGYWESAQTVLRDITDVQSVEKIILHRDLCYKGQFDCIASYRDKPMLIDWKTSKKPRATLQATYDNPLQVAAYTGAYNNTPEREMVDNAMIVVCYEDGQPAHSHQMTRSMCIDYWTKWLQRLHAFWMNKFSLKPEARK